MYRELDWARNSFKYTIKHFELKKVHMPYYLCDVMRHWAVASGCKPVFYHIDDKFLPEKDFLKDEYILYPNYFGICDNNVEILAKEYPNLIVDNAHSYFAAPKGIACFNSKKKFFENENISELWILENKDEREKNHKAIDKRNMIFEKYKAKLGESNLIKTDYKYSPFCYPYLARDTETANKLAKELSANGLTIYRYWNELPKSYSEYKFYSRLVPIPLDKDCQI